MNKFKVGDRVIRKDGFHVGDEGTAQSVGVTSDCFYAHVLWDDGIPSAINEKDLTLIQAVTTQTPATPKFKVGDRVKWSSMGDIGTVTCVFPTYFAEPAYDIKRDDGSYVNVYESYLTLVQSAPAPQPCPLITTGASIPPSNQISGDAIDKLKALYADVAEEMKRTLQGSSFYPHTANGPHGTSFPDPYKDIDELKQQINEAYEYMVSTRMLPVAGANCDHAWETYNGLFESFEHCSKCGERRK